VEHTGAKAFTVRRARLSDMPGLQEVFVRASMSNENDRPLLLKHPERLELSDDAVRERRTRVAVDQSDAVIGFATYLISDGMAELAEVFVDPLHVRCGVGRALVTVISEHMQEMKYESLDVIANPSAKAFYEHMGFEADEVVDTEGSPALRMRKPIRRC
jgi:N-acetylglutamate synthase-like GNAT family acetyltransferase